MTTEVTRTLHPMQSLVLDDHGTIRFRENRIVGYLFAAGAIDLNKLALMPFSAEDRMQLAQLLGYSVGGYSELSYVSDESYYEADAAAEVIRATLTTPPKPPEGG